MNEETERTYKCDSCDNIVHESEIRADFDGVGGWSNKVCPHCYAADLLDEVPADQIIS